MGVAQGWEEGRGSDVETLKCQPNVVGSSVQFSSVQSLSCVQLFETPWTAAHKTSLSITNSRSLLKLMSIESVMPSNHLILCHLLLLLHSIFPSIRVFSSESALHISWLSIRDFLGPSKSRVALWPQNFYPQTRLECGEGRAESMAALATHMLPVGFMLWRTRSC